MRLTDMAEILAVRIDWDHTATLQRMADRFYTLRVQPETDYPFGRKGLALASAWRQLAHKGQSGMLILDGDVIIDPADYRAMLDAIHGNDDWVWLAPVKLWPVSTKRDDWIWSHWVREPSKEVDFDATVFSFCFTYLPRRVIELALRNGMRGWTYPTCDTRMSELCTANDIDVGVVQNCWPKHVNY